MREQYDEIRRMWNNPHGTDDEALDWVIAHAKALGERLRLYIQVTPAPEVTDE